MRLGLLGEDFLTQVFLLDHPAFIVERCQEKWLRPDYPRFSATPDNLVIEPSGEIGVLETWLISHFRKHQFDDAANLSPEEKIAQMQWQLLLSPNDLQFGWIQAFMGNGDDESPANRYNRDPILIDLMIEQANKFLFCVDNDKPPQLLKDDYEMFVDYLWRSQKQIAGKRKRLGGAEHQLINEYVELDAQRLAHNRAAAVIDKRQSEIKNNLLIALDDAEIGDVNGYQVYLDTFVRTGYTVQPVEKKVLKIKSNEKAKK